MYTNAKRPTKHTQVKPVSVRGYTSYVYPGVRPAGIARDIEIQASVIVGCTARLRAYTTADRKYNNGKLSRVPQWSAKVTGGKNQARHWFVQHCESATQLDQRFQRELRVVDDSEYEAAVQATNVDDDSFTATSIMNTQGIKATFSFGTAAVSSSSLTPSREVKSEAYSLPTPVVAFACALLWRDVTQMISTLPVDLGYPPNTYANKFHEWVAAFALPSSDAIAEYHRSASDLVDAFVRVRGDESALVAWMTAYDIPDYGIWSLAKELAEERTPAWAARLRVLYNELAMFVASYRAYLSEVYYDPEQPVLVSTIGACYEVIMGITGGDVLDSADTVPTPVRPGNPIVVDAQKIAVSSETIARLELTKTLSYLVHWMARLDSAEAREATVARQRAQRGLPLIPRTLWNDILRPIHSISSKACVGILGNYRALLLQLESLFSLPAGGNNSKLAAELFQALRSRFHTFPTEIKHHLVDRPDLLPAFFARHREVMWRTEFSIQPTALLLRPSMRAARGPLGYIIADHGVNVTQPNVAAFMRLVAREGYIESHKEQGAEAKRRARYIFNRVVAPIDTTRAIADEYLHLQARITEQHGAQTAETVVGDVGRNNAQFLQQLSMEPPTEPAPSLDDGPIPTARNLEGIPNAVPPLILQHAERVGRTVIRYAQGIRKNPRSLPVDRAVFKARVKAVTATFETLQQVVHDVVEKEANGKLQLDRAYGEFKNRVTDLEPVMEMQTGVFTSVDNTIRAQTLTAEWIENIPGGQANVNYIRAPDPIDFWALVKKIEAAAEDFQQAVIALRAYASQAEVFIDEGDDIVDEEDTMEATGDTYDAVPDDVTQSWWSSIPGAQVLKKLRKLTFGAPSVDGVNQNIVLRAEGRTGGRSSITLRNKDKQGWVVAGDTAVLKLMYTVGSPGNLMQEYEMNSIANHLTGLYLSSHLYVRQRRLATPYAIGDVVADVFGLWGGAILVSYLSDIVDAIDGPSAGPGPSEEPGSTEGEAKDGAAGSGPPEEGRTNVGEEAPSVGRYDLPPHLQEIIPNYNPCMNIENFGSLPDDDKNAINEVYERFMKDGNSCPVDNDTTNPNLLGNPLSGAAEELEKLVGDMRKLLKSMKEGAWTGVQDFKAMVGTMEVGTTAYYTLFAIAAVSSVLSGLVVALYLKRVAYNDKKNPAEAPPWWIPASMLVSVPAMIYFTSNVPRDIVNALASIGATLSVEALALMSMRVAVGMARYVKRNVVDPILHRWSPMPLVPAARVEFYGTIQVGGTRSRANKTQTLDVTSIDDILSRLPRPEESYVKTAVATVIYFMTQALSELLLKQDLIVPTLAAILPRTSFWRIVLSQAIIVASQFVRNGLITYESELVGKRRGPIARDNWSYYARYALPTIEYKEGETLVFQRVTSNLRAEDKK